MESEGFIVADETMSIRKQFESLEEARFFCRFTPATTWFIYERVVWGFNASGSLGADVPSISKSRWNLVETIPMPGKIIKGAFSRGYHGEE